MIGPIVRVEMCHFVKQQMDLQLILLLPANADQPHVLPAPDFIVINLIILVQLCVATSMEHLSI